DFSGIADYRMIDELGGIQWPYPEESQPEESQRRLFADGRFYHADGRAKFIFEASRPMSELPNKEYPLILLTDRGSVSQWHTQTRTNKSAVLRKLYPANLYVEINPHDARALGVKPNEVVYVESQRGSIQAKVFI